MRSEMTGENVLKSIANLRDRAIRPSARSCDCDFLRRETPCAATIVPILVESVYETVISKLYTPNCSA